MEVCVVECEDARWCVWWSVRTRGGVCGHLDQQSDGAALVHLQDFSVLGAHEDVPVAQRYGTYGRVVFQEQPCGAQGGSTKRCVRKHVNE